MCFQPRLLMGAEFESSTGSLGFQLVNLKFRLSSTFTAKKVAFITVQTKLDLINLLVTFLKSEIFTIYL